MTNRWWASIVGMAAIFTVAATPAFADVQNVKVSGDINVKGITRDNFDLKSTVRVPGAAPTSDDRLATILQTTHLQVDADLTDNVATTVRLVNQRFWDADVEASNNVDIDAAYLTLKEFLYSPLTVTVGRQDLNFGTGLIVSNVALLADPNTLFGGAQIATTGVHGSQAREFSDYNEYDAIRATLDFAPLVADFIVAKITEQGEGGHDQDLYGINLNWKGAPFGRVKGEGELYWFWKNDDAATYTIHDNGRTYEKNDVHVIGGRTGFEPVANLWLDGEVAYQFGEIEDTSLVAGQPAQTRDRSAWAAGAAATYTFANVQYTPSLGVSWLFLSGEEAGGTNDADDVETWDQMFRGKGCVCISDYFAGTDAGYGYYTTFDPSDTDAGTNRHHLMVDLGAKPIDELALQVRYAHVWFDEVPVAGRSSSVGDEFNLQAKWSYTEDVLVSLLGAWFFPGNYYDGAAVASRGNNTAWQVVGDVTVKF